MVETVVPVGRNDREIELLEEWLPMLNAKERAYIKGATEALIYAQEDAAVPAGAVPCLRSHKASG